MPLREKWLLHCQISIPLIEQNQIKSPARTISSLERKTMERNLETTNPQLDQKLHVALGKKHSPN
jgi:hypothetical protein